MIRNVIIGITAVLFSGLLIVLAGWITVHSDDMRLILDVAVDHYAGQQIDDDQVEKVFSALERGYFHIKWLILPVIALIVGSFAGLLSRKFTWQLGVISAAPFAIVFSVGIYGMLSGIVILILYLTVAGLGALATAKLRQILHTDRPTSIWPSVVKEKTTP